MSVLKAGFESAELFQKLKNRIDGFSSAEKDGILKKVNAVFEIVVKNKNGSEQSWTLELKEIGKISLG